jgi:hypothetical protein
MPLQGPSKQSALRRAETRAPVLNFCYCRIRVQKRMPWPQSWKVAHNKCFLWDQKLFFLEFLRSR